MKAMGISKEQKKLIFECAKSRGFGSDTMHLDGAIEWTQGRLNEYAEHLPRLWCNEEVYSWMLANDTEAKRILPKLESAYESGIRYYYEFSPYTRPMYLEYKNLESMHEDVYDKEHHVFRGAARECDELKARQSVEVQIDDVWSAIDALDESTEVHSRGWYKRLVEAAETAREREK